MPEGSVVVIGGTGGIGNAIAQHYAAEGRSVVITSRDQGRADRAAREIGGDTTGLAVDIAEPEEIADRLSEVGDVAYLVVTAIDAGRIFLEDYDLEAAQRLSTLKLVGYTEVVHTLLDRLSADSSIVLFGGLAKARPYPGSTMVTAVNGGVTALVRTLAVQLAPTRINAIHPSVIGNSPRWKDAPEEVLEAFRERTPLGRLIEVDEVVDAVAFLLENTAVNALNLRIDGGWMVT